MGGRVVVNDVVGMGVVDYCQGFGQQGFGGFGVVVFGSSVYLFDGVVKSGEVGVVVVVLFGVLMGLFMSGGVVGYEFFFFCRFIEIED